MPGMQMGHDKHSPVSEIRNALVTAWNAGDLDKLTMLYSEAAVLILPNGRLVTGRQSIREYLQRASPRRTRVALTSVGSDSSADLQTDFGIFSGSKQQPETGHSGRAQISAAQQEAEGKYLMVVKRVGQDWKIQEQVFVLTGKD
jgi:ketosteroid isomerase-like protein